MMNSNASTPISETKSAAWGNSLAGYLSDFPAIAHMLNTEGLSSDPSVLMDFMRDFVRGFRPPYQKGLGRYLRQLLGIKPYAAHSWLISKD
jgi:hypothetical protein